MNYIINEDETEINIKDMLTYCLLHWRKALCLMLVAGIAAGAITGVMKGISTNKLIEAYQEYLEDPAALQTKQSNTTYAQKNGIELSDEEKITSEEEQILEEVATLDSINNMSDIISQTRRDLMSMTDYYNDSIIMQVDPQSVPTAEADILITVPSDAPANSVSVLAAAYVDYLASGNYLDEYASEKGIDVKYLKEAVTVSDITFGNNTDAASTGSSSGSSGDTTVNTDVSFQISTDAATDRVGLIIIKCVGTSAQDSLELLEFVVSEIDSYREATSETICAHETETVNYFFNMLHDESIANLQTATSEELVDLQENLEVYIKSLKNLQKENGDLIVNSMNELPSAPLEGIKTGVKFGAVVLFAVFLFFNLFIIIKYILSNVALTKAQLINRFAIFDLGSVKNGEGKLYKHGAKFDKWLRRIDRLGEGNTDAAAAAVANLEVYGPEVKTILAVGTGDVIKSLKGKVKNRKILYSSSLVDDPQSRIYLSEADGVIIEVKYGESKFDDIREQIKLVQLAGKPITGYVAE